MEAAASKIGRRVRAGRGGLQMNIVLIGFMGTGKSAIGHALAQRLGAHFYDTDAEIEKEANKHVAQIFQESGETAFRQMETRLLWKLANEKTPRVVATGGGTPLRAENVRLLKKIGPLVWLTAPDQAILGRVRSNIAKRPLLAGHTEDPLARIRQMLAARNPVYAAIQDYELDTSNFHSPADAANCILTLMGQNTSLSHFEGSCPPRSASPSAAHARPVPRL